MSLDADSPGELLSQLADIGLPFHGLAMGGVMTLASGVTIPYPTPASCDVHVVRRPGWTAPERSPEQLALDAELNHDWRDYELLAGTLRPGMGFGSMMLGGLPKDASGRGVDGWIWYDPAGTSWRVRITSWGNLADTDAYQLTLQFALFGPLGATAEEYSRTTDPFSLAQGDAPGQEVRPTPGGIYRTLQHHDTALQVKLLDVRPDGAAVLFAVWVPHFSDTHIDADIAPGIYTERVVGVFEITIDEAGVPSGAAVKSRSECLGGRNWPSVGTLFDLTTVMIDGPGGLNMCGLPSHNWGPEVFTATAVETAGWQGTYHGGSQPRGVPGPDYSGSGSPYGAGSLSPGQEYTHSTTGIVIGGHYNVETGEREIVEVDIELRHEFGGEHELTLDPAVRSVTCAAGVLDDTGEIDWTFTGSEQSHMQHTVRLRCADTTLCEEVHEVIREGTISGHRSSNSATGTSSVVHKHNGEIIAEGSAEHAGDLFTLSGGGDPRTHAISWIGIAAISSGQFTVPAVSRMLDTLPVRLVASGSFGPAWRITPAHWSETTIGLVSAEVTRLGVTVFGEARHDFRTAYARGVPVPGSEQTYTPATNVDVLVWPRGSYQPVTGQWSGEVGETMPALRAWV